MDFLSDLLDGFRAALGLGPVFILAEPGTDPLADPELYKRRRRRGLPVWIPLVIGVVIVAATWGTWWFLRAR